MKTRYPGMILEWPQLHVETSATSYALLISFCFRNITYLKWPYECQNEKLHSKISIFQLSEYPQTHLVSRQNALSVDIVVSHNMITFCCSWHFAIYIMDITVTGQWLGIARRPNFKAIYQTFIIMPICSIKKTALIHSLRTIVTCNPL